MDDEWLYAATNTADGSQLVASDNDGPVGLIGIVWDPDGRRHVITDITVHPARRRSGFGRKVLASATRWTGHPPARGWAAFVDVNNHAANKFFRAAGWRNEGLDDGMRRYTLDCDEPINAEMAVGGIVQVMASIAVSGAPATGATLPPYRVDDNGTASQIAPDTVDPNWPFEMNDLPPGEYTVYADTSTRSEEPAPKSQWLGGTTSKDGVQTLSVSLD